MVIITKVVALISRRDRDHPANASSAPISKGVPFVFISTNATKVSVRHAHALSVQGYFEKPQSIESIKEMFRTLFAYWELCKHIDNTL